MAEKDTGDDGPSLELPSFGLGRKKKQKAKESDPVAEPVAEPADETAAEPSPTPYADAQPEPTPEPTPPPAPPARVAAPEPAAAPAPEPTPGPAPAPVSVSAAEPAPEPVREPRPQKAPKPKREPRPRRDVSFPTVPGLWAALGVGALIGMLAVLLTFSSLKLCEVVGGTDSCGGSGLLLLVAILVLLTYLGGWLLRGFRIEDPLSTSFLAVGLLAVMGMLFFLDVIYSRWMIVVIPLVSMASYALSWWVTTRIVDTEESGAS